MKDEQGFDPDLNYSQEDNEFWDATDRAHPAWYRGNDAATTICSKIILDELGVKVPDDAGIARCWHLAITAVRKLAKEKEALLESAISYESMACNFDTDILPKEAWEELDQAEIAMDKYRSIGKDD